MEMLAEVVAEMLHIGPQLGVAAGFTAKLVSRSSWALRAYMGGRGICHDFRQHLHYLSSSSPRMS